MKLASTTFFICFHHSTSFSSHCDDFSSFKNLTTEARLLRNNILSVKFRCLNPLTLVTPITGRDEPGPFFHFWRHHIWPKLAWSTCIFNFCRRKRSFQWCPDQSDRQNGAWDMHKNAKKVEWKTQSKISCQYTWLLHAKICSSWWRFLRSFLTASKQWSRWCLYNFFLGSRAQSTKKSVSKE